MSDQTCEFLDLKAIVQYTGEPKAESGALSWKQLMETGEKALEELKEEMAKKLDDIAVNQVLSLPIQWVFLTIFRQFQANTCRNS